jgi:hypothetical protein
MAVETGSEEVGEVICSTVHAADWRRARVRVGRGRVDVETGHCRVECALVQVVGEVVEELAVGTLGTVSTQPETTERALKVVAEPAVATATLAVEKVAAHASGTAAATHAPGTHTAAQLRVQRSTVEAASALSEKALARRGMVDSAAAVESDHGAGRSDTLRSGSARTRVRILGHEHGHGGLKVIASTVEGILELATGNGGEDRGQDVEGCHAECRILGRVIFGIERTTRLKRRRLVRLGGARRSRRRREELWYLVAATACTKRLKRPGSRAET